MEAKRVIDAEAPRGPRGVWGFGVVSSRDGGAAFAGLVQATERGWQQPLVRVFIDKSLGRYPRGGPASSCQQCSNKANTATTSDQIASPLGFIFSYYS